MLGLAAVANESFDVFAGKIEMKGIGIAHKSAARARQNIWGSFDSGFFHDCNLFSKKTLFSEILNYKLSYRTFG